MSKKVVVKKAAKKVVPKKVVKKVVKCNVSKNGRCGKAFHNTICASGFCSKWNWCGSSALHKSTHQAAFDAKKSCAVKKAVKKVVVKKAAKKVVVKKVAKKVVKCNVSKNGRCGK